MASICCSPPECPRSRPTAAVSELTTDGDSSVACDLFAAVRQPMSRRASAITLARSSGRAGVPSPVSGTGASFAEAIRL